MNYRQEEAGAPSAPKTLPSHYLYPRDVAIVFPPRKLPLGFFIWEYIFPLPRLSLVLSPVIQRLRYPEPGRLGILFLFCRKACATELQIQTVCAFVLVVVLPTLCQLYSHLTSMGAWSLFAKFLLNTPAKWQGNWKQPWKKYFWRQDDLNYSTHVCLCFPFCKEQVEDWSW